MRCSVIIPTLNEEDHIDQLLLRLEQGSCQTTEIILVDGGSTDKTIERARKYSIKILQSVRPGRALQMNLGVREATGDVFYFVHGDTIPPLTYMKDIKQAISEGYDLGCYRFKFEGNQLILRINAFFTRFNKSWCRGGDQSLFIKKEVFNALGGYREQYVIMEDFELLRRALPTYFFKIMPKDIIVSRRKYDDNNYLRVQFANLIVFNMFKFGYEPGTILNTYRRLINYRS